MCELFGLSSNSPVELSKLLQLFGERGGKTADNPDGWGVAYRKNGTWQLYKGTDAAAQSQHYRNSIQNLRSNLAVAHVRKANPPSPCVSENTHPFVRDCCAQSWVFAHNGKVPEVTHPNGCCYPKQSSPLGITDSEHAFYFLLDELANSFHYTEAISHSEWLKTLARHSEAIAAFGQFNFLMSDGSHLIVYGHDRLYTLDQKQDHSTTVIVASEPLTDDAWQACHMGELSIYHNGVLLGNVLTNPNPVSLQLNPTEITTHQRKQS